MGAAAALPSHPHLRPSHARTQAFEMGAREVQLQTWGSTVQAMSSNALNLAGIDPRRVVVKLPCTPEGIQAASLLSESDIRVTITGVAVRGRGRGEVRACACMGGRATQASFRTVCEFMWISCKIGWMDGGQ
eukprot:359412-Chlamydomonas_euryale.AAC.11